MAASQSTDFLDLQAAVAGRYSLEREIGRGGMAVVFLARDVALERPVAVKLLPRHLAHDPALRERFLREARTAAQLMHPNIVPIHAVEATDDVVFFAMAFVDGETLTERVQRKGPLTAVDATRLMQEVAWALGYAHGRGVIHRDIKPDNILIEHASGRAMVADFGIARVASRDTLSADGALMGTVQYMSPEQAGSEELDARTDLYSLGATLYFALTGTSPVEAPTLPAMISRLMTEVPASVAAVRAGVPPALAEVVTRSLAKDRAARFATADELAAALQGGQGGPPELRPEVRAFLREVTAGKVVLIGGLSLLVGGVLFAVTGIVRGAGLAIIMTLGSGALALFAAAVAGAIGNLRRDMVPWDEVESGIARELADLLEYGKRQLSRRRNVKRMFTILGIGMTAIGASELFVGWRQLHDASPELGRVTLMLGGIATGVGILYLVIGGWKKVPEQWIVDNSRWSPDGATLVLLRRLMRWGPLARFYAKGASAAPSRVPSALPTATLLLQRVEALVAQLPESMRSRLGDVLPAAARLERAISALRARIAELDEAVAELPAESRARAEFAAAREHATAQLVECVGALERLRTDLLRLGAGLIAADGITAELEKAQELSASIDAELHGLDEVRRIGAGD